MGSLLAIMLHPRRAHERIDALRRQLAACESKTAELCSKNESERLLLERRAEQAEGLLRLKEEQLDHALESRDRTIAELERTRRELDEARSEIDEYSMMETKLRQLDTMMGRIEDMRRGYERRIAALRSQLAKALESSVRSSPAPLPRHNYTSPPTPKKKAPEPPEPDWLKDLPPRLR